MNCQAFATELSTLAISFVCGSFSRDLGREYKAVTAYHQNLVLNGLETTATLIQILFVTV